MKIDLKKLVHDAIVPTRGSDRAGGWDLYATKGCVVGAGQTVSVGTGVAVAIPEGYVGLIFARSGLATKKGLAPANKVGVIDSDYRGELIVVLHNHSVDRPQMVAKGDRIAQLVIVPCLDCEFTVVDELNDTARGCGGFGSTGV